MKKEKVVLPIFQLELLLNSRHETLPIVKTIPSGVPSLTQGFLYNVNQPKSMAGA